MPPPAAAPTAPPPLGAQGMVELEREVATLVRLAHPNIMQVFGLAARLDAWEDPAAEHFMISELCAGGDLELYIRSASFEAPGELGRVLLELLSGVAYIHAKGVAHRDLVSCVCVCWALGVISSGDGTERERGTGVA